MANMHAVDESDDPSWQQGTFQILFLSMGQGDCCVITCPDGQHVMIDCGSKALEAADAMADIQSLIHSRGVINHQDSFNGRISALILTHPDKDHITKVAEIIGGEAYEIRDETKTFDPIPVDTVYFSDHKTGRTDFRNSPLRYYGTSLCATTLYYYSKVQDMYCVTLKTGEKILHKWVPPFDKTGYTSALIGSDRVTVCAGTTYDGEDEIAWEVSIIAGNVARAAGDQSDTDGRNAASLVTLVRRGEETALICGDATISTENYLYNTFRKTDVIRSVTLLQAPHHGSSLTSSSTNFVNLVKPQRVAISVQKDEHSHHLPGIETVRAYIANAVGAKSHPVTGWRTMEHDEFYDATNRWVADKVKYVEEADNQFRTARFVRQGVDGSNFTGDVILDGFTRQTKYALHQSPLNRDVKQTGIDHHLFYYFP
jgi:beta-lactamase superfamily II metal-dependent hydrolase